LRGIDIVLSFLSDPIPARIARDAGVRVIDGLSTTFAGGIPETVFDLPYAGRLAARNLLDHQMADFAFMSPVFCRYAKPCLGGFVETIQAAHRNVFVCLLPCQFDANLGAVKCIPRHTPIYEWLAFLQRPIGIFCTAQGIARLVQEVANEIHLYPGADYHIVSLQDCISARIGMRGGGFCDEVAFPMTTAASCLVKMLRDDACQHRVGTERLLPFIAAANGTSGCRTPRDALGLAIRYIDANIGRSYSIREVADHAGCSRRVLERHFRQLLGGSVLSVIQEHRAERAKNLLATGNSPVKEIAQAVGYCTPAQFHAVFRRLVGMTPTEFRRSVCRRFGPVSNSRRTG
jgi:AraC-like DNA-binding protein